MYFILLFINLFFGVIRNIVAGFCVAKTWSWFIVPTYHVAGLSYGQAIGTCIALGFIATAAGLASEGEAGAATAENASEVALKAVIHNIALIVILPFSLGIAYVWHLFI